MINQLIIMVCSAHFIILYLIVLNVFSVFVNSYNAGYVLMEFFGQISRTSMYPWILHKGWHILFSDSICSSNAVWQFFKGPAGDNNYGCKEFINSTW